MQARKMFKLLKDVKKKQSTGAITEADVGVFIIDAMQLCNTKEKAHISSLINRYMNKGRTVIGEETVMEVQ